jgi:tetratricopeptide (TPR) repeat protein
MRAEARACELHHRALERLDAGDLRGAKRTFIRALELFERAGASARGDAANVLVELATTEHRLGDLEQARTRLERASKLLVGLRGRDVQRLRARAGSDLALVLIDLGEYTAALPIARRAARIADRLPAADRAAVFNTLGIACKYTGRFEEGLAAYRRAGRAARYVSDPLFLATLEHNLGGILHARGDLRGAEPHSRRAAEIRSQQLGPEHPDVLADEAALAAVLDGLQRWHEAETIYRRVIAGFTAAFGPRHPEVAHALGNYAAHLQLGGHCREAARMHRRAITSKRRALGEQHPSTALERVNLAVLEIGRGRPARAIPLLESALSSCISRLGDRHADTQDCRALLADAKSTACM